jgi:hypothetical protein
MRQTEEVEGWVWCDKHQEVHGDTLNPRGYIEDGNQDYCLPHHHHGLFTITDYPSDVYLCNCLCHFPDGWRWKEGDPRPTNMKPCEECREVLHMSPKGEYSGVEAEQFLEQHAKPEPVRHSPVPMTVRRHTEESRAIWRQNLIDALPIDMLVEDRYKIADQLLEVTIEQGNLLRRKRLIDKLLVAAEAMEDAAEHAGAKRLAQIPTEGLREWGDLLADAAEEIRSVL